MFDEYNDRVRKWLFATSGYKATGRKKRAKKEFDRKINRQMGITKMKLQSKNHGK
jgi:hypothetical protein